MLTRVCGGLLEWVLMLLADSRKVPDGFGFYTVEVTFTAGAAE